MASETEAVRLWEGDVVLQYAFDRDCSQAVALRHWHMREVLQRYGYVPSLEMLQDAMRRRGITISRRVLVRDLRELGWPG